MWCVETNIFCFILGYVLHLELPNQNCGCLTLMFFQLFIRTPKLHLLVVLKKMNISDFVPVLQIGSGAAAARDSRGEHRPCLLLLLLIPFLLHSQLLLTRQFSLKPSTYTAPISSVRSLGTTTTCGPSRRFWPMNFKSDTQGAPSSEEGSSLTSLSYHIISEPPCYLLTFNLIACQFLSTVV